MQEFYEQLHDMRIFKTDARPESHLPCGVAVRSILVWLTSLRNLVALQILVNNKSRGTPLAAIQLAFHFHAFRVTWKIIADKAFEYEHLTRALRHNRVVGAALGGRVGSRPRSSPSLYCKHK